MTSFPTQRVPDPSETDAPAPIVARAAFVMDLLTTTTAAGLPSPRYVTFHDNVAQVGIQLASPADVHTWAQWLDVTPRLDAADSSGGGLHRANGRWRETSIHAYHVEYREGAA